MQEERRYVLEGLVLFASYKDLNISLGEATSGERERDI